MATESEELLQKACDCASAKLWPHRKLKCPSRRAAAALAPGIYCRNESEFPILFVLSQLSPLHWDRVEPGETKQLKCGRVFFTISTEIYNEATVPTAEGVAARIGAIATASVLTGGVIGLGVVGGISGISSSKGAKQDGVLADGRTVVIRGQLTPVGAYELFIFSIEAKR